MTLTEIKTAALAQLGLDSDDLADIDVLLTRYINEGYDTLVEVYGGVHVDQVVSEATPYPKLALGSDEPKVPVWTHRALCDYATWMSYRNGSAQKQNKGVPFYQAFEQVKNRLRYTDTPKFSGLYR